MADKSIYIFTDGACSGNPGPGGWGIVITEQNPEGNEADYQDILNTAEVKFAGEPQTTNNRMELMAAIEALRHAETTEAQKIHIYTDSTYVRQGICSWIHTWMKKDWKSASGKPVKNRDLWQLLYDLDSGLNVEWHWIRGHSGHPLNERADYLARHAITQQIMKQNLQAGLR